MTDRLIEEIYTLADAALTNRQKFFRVHCFPFRMTVARMAKAERAGSPWLPFWSDLKRGYDLFEKDGVPPDTRVAGKRYRFVSGKK
jgi:murein L,D-transpeptidase YafK